MKYVVTIDRHYYPEVNYHETLEDAQAQRDRLLAEGREGSDQSVVRVVIAEIVEVAEMSRES
jgi:hypothetical protein